MIADVAGTGLFSCAVDVDRRFHLDALRWFAALTRVAGIAPDDIVLHTVDGSTSEVVEYARRRGARVRAVQAFDRRAPHCNKIAAALELASAGVAGTAVLTDVDVVVTADPRSLRLGARSIAAKAVDGPNPPLEVLEAVFGQARLELPPLVQPDLDRSSPTIAGNANGGLYLVPGHLLSELSTAWSWWARWLLDSDVLGEYRFFTDQVAMAMALAAEGIELAPLAREWNTPTHVPEWVSTIDTDPLVVHYHERVEPTGPISTTGNPRVDAVVEAVNAATAGVWEKLFPQTGAGASHGHRQTQASQGDAAGRPAANGDAETSR